MVDFSVWVGGGRRIMGDREFDSWHWALRPFRVSSSTENTHFITLTFTLIQILSTLLTHRHCLMVTCPLLANLLRRKQGWPDRAVTSSKSFPIPTVCSMLRQ